MSEQEIIKTLRRIAKDLNEIGYAKVVKIDTTTLLSHGPDTAGGALVQWFNREQDQRRKAVLLELTQLVVRAYSNQPNAIENAAKLIPGLCDRIEGEPDDTPENIVDAVLRKFYKVWTKRESHAKAGKAMVEKITVDEWKAYKKAKQGKPITATIENHFTRLSTTWQNDRKLIPKNLK